MTNYHPEYKPACKLANTRIAELEAENERLGDLVRRCMKVGCQWCGLDAASFDVEQRVLRQVAHEEGEK